MAEMRELPFAFGFERDRGRDPDLPEREASSPRAWDPSPTGSGEPALYTVSQLNARVRELLELSFPEIGVEGEISNFRSYASGHLYFTLKDEASEIEAVMFQSRAASLDFQPEDGMSVLAWGTVTVYERRGRYQLEVRRLKPAGVGKLQQAFERLKEKLQAEGLFEEAYKKPIPAYPERIGIVTSPEGAALRDVISILSRRYPLVEVRVFPVKVQGEGAAEEIAHAIGLANAYHLREEPLDALIVGRGGGSLEDLWAFNEEVVARAIFRSQVPVISAVGHEIDFTIADFVADLRAPTPSAAAELVVPDRAELCMRLRDRVRRLRDGQRARLEDLRMRLRMAVSSYAFRRPLRALQDAFQSLDHLRAEAVRAERERLLEAQQRVDRLLGQLEAMNPLAVLRRGYALVEDAQGRPLTSSRQVQIGERIRVRLREGRLHCEVLGREGPLE